MAYTSTARVCSQFKLRMQRYGLGSNVNSPSPPSASISPGRGAWDGSKIPALPRMSVEEVEPSSSYSSSRSPSSEESSEELDAEISPRERALRYAMRVSMLSSRSNNPPSPFSSSFFSASDRSSSSLSSFSPSPSSSSRPSSTRPSSLSSRRGCRFFPFFFLVLRPYLSLVGTHPNLSESNAALNRSSDAMARVSESPSPEEDATADLLISAPPSSSTSPSTCPSTRFFALLSLL
mmetsp:Transcript_1702/g.3790  ORF Transcript_1702/g.3790 Transcript_1702/m.3790 type:complete len:235 (-) Transcript_1702:354-1058(-)